MNALNRLLNPIKRQLRLSVSRCVVALINDAAKLQELQVTLLADEAMDKREHFQHYGFTSVPHPGAEGIMLSVNGQRSQGVVINVDDRRYRLKGMQSGEVAIYDDLGNYLKMGRNSMDINAVTTLNITSPSTTINSDVVVNGDVVANGISLVNHTHPGDSGGTTGAPQ